MKERFCKMNIQEMSVKQEAKVYDTYLQAIEQLAEKTGRSVDEARYALFGAIGAGMGILDAYVCAYKSLEQLNEIGV
jgi:hypothetical protein